MAKAAAAVSRMGMSLVTKTGNSAKGLQAYAIPRLQTFWKYAKVEMKPPSLGEMGQVQEGINNIIVSARTGKWKQLTVRQAGLNTLVGLEVLMWFYIGEIIGKRNIVGYYIPGAVHYEGSV
ncbi:ATP synthase subunit g, mitochondrial-like [Haliotis asinina]|uniref:ATP synthase subunit g, mitochondrial-like n=1 Tax=Haliotis asinina TaxID=109174 RepID=UPI003531C3B4